METRIGTAGQPLSPSRYPILRFIDAARGDLLPRFADDPGADRLEACARRLTALYWSDLVWVTGAVPASCFRRVCEELERERAIAEHTVSLPQTGSAA